MSPARARRTQPDCKRHLTAANTNVHVTPLASELQVIWAMFFLVLPRHLDCLIFHAAARSALKAKQKSCWSPVACSFRTLATTTGSACSKSDDSIY